MRRGKISSRGGSVAQSDRWHKYCGQFARKCEHVLPPPVLQDIARSLLFLSPVSARRQSPTTGSRAASRRPSTSSQREREPHVTVDSEGAQSLCHRLMQRPPPALVRRGQC